MKQKVVQTYEYARDHLKNSELHERDKRILEELCKSGVIRKVEDGYKTRKFVGLLPLYSKSVEILPKIFKNGSYYEDKKSMHISNRRMLLRILTFVNDLPIKESDVVGKNLEKNDFFEIMRYLFAKKLMDELQRGMNRSYETFEENELFLKGKLLILNNMRQNSLTKNKFYLCHDEFTEDNTLNRIFNYVVKNIVSSAGNLSRRYLIELSSAFSDVELEPDVIRNLNRVTLNRLNERFWPHFQMAKMFLGKQVPTVYSGKDVKTYNFLFDMEKLFESFVGMFLKKYKQSINSMIHDVRTQEPQKFGQLSIKPDVIIQLEKQIIVVDTKYTGVPTEEDSKNPHLYQIYTYCMRQKQHGAGKKVSGVLLYPKHLNEHEKVSIRNDLGPIHIGEGDADLSVTVYRRLLDLRIEDPQDFKNAFIRKFQEIFAEVIETD